MDFATITLLVISLASHLKPSLCAGEQTNLNFCMDKKMISLQTLSGSGDSDSCKCMVGETVDPYSRPDYKHVPGVGSYKLHTEPANWNDARKICQQENAYLAVVNSKEERKVLVKMLKKNAYLGIHNYFEDGEWTTVYGESLYSTGYDGWSKMFYGGQPDGSGHCGALIADGSGMDDVNCESKYPFLCELTSICEGFHIMD